MEISRRGMLSAALLTPVPLMHERPAAATELTNAPVAGSEAAAQSEHVVNVRDHGAVGDGVTNDTGAIRAAIAAVGSGGIVYVPAGEYLCGGLVITSGVTLRGDGQGKTTLLMANTTGGLLIAGQPIPKTHTTVLSADAAPESETLAVASSADISAGDWLLLTDSTVYDTNYASRIAGEMVQVASVEPAGTIKLVKPVIGVPAPAGGWQAYATSSSARVTRLPMQKDIVVESLTMRWARPTEGKNHGISMVCATNSLVRDVEFVGFDGAGLSLNTCHNVRVRDCFMHDLTDDGENGRYGYGVNLGGAVQNSTISGCHFERVRHAVTTNGHDIGGIPRFITISDCHAYDTTNASFDTHGAGEYITFSDCSAFRNWSYSFSTRARYTVFRGCRSVMSKLEGFNISSGGTMGRECVVDSCTVERAGRYGILVREGHKNARIVNSAIDSPASHGVRGTYGSDGLRVENCRLTDCGRAGEEAFGIKWGGTEVPTAGFVVLGCTFSNPSGHDFRVAVEVGAPIRSGVVGDNRGWGLRGSTYIQLGGKAAVHGNWFVNSANVVVPVP
ncbi:glycosyl hydrolase family 28-related protein [Promicromonospora sp. CA-289599]|uniref:glycosyl hydrolase family 28-related protein n=1 Tax=Promicromonospora sp. CA-289599 TaxID=3240014 RepID=UPI003D90BD6E